METGESFCVLQGCDEFVVNTDCSEIKQAVSIVHECSDSCTFDWGSREASGEKALKKGNSSQDDGITWGGTADVI
ncbi:hypothetical protein EMCRGX_G031454 [Ephydatia muelleri]